MSPELAATVGFVVAAVATLLATPVVIAAAIRTDFYDHPHDYHRHLASTPLLGGAAVMAGFLLAAVAVGASGKLLVLPGCALVMWAVGTVDDRTPIAPAWRLLPETAGAVALVLAGLGWRVSGDGVGDIVLTTLWVVGLVNAFNLMDNLDGACGTVAAVSALGIGTLAAIDGEATVAGLAFALAGACLAFLRWNLAGPAKIFLGDGGSRPIGLLVAGLAMLSARRLPMGDANVLVGAMLAGLVILDTTLVTVSRTRRGVTVMTGGRDHLTHRLLLVRDSPGAVAAVLAIAQATLCALAIAGERLGTGPLVVLAVAAASCGVIAIAVLETARWRPPGIAVGTTPAATHRIAVVTTSAATPGTVGLTQVDRR